MVRLDLFSVSISQNSQHRSAVFRANYANARPAIFHSSLAPRMRNKELSLSRLDTLTSLQSFPQQPSIVGQCVPSLWTELCFLVFYFLEILFSNNCQDVEASFERHGSVLVPINGSLVGVGDIMELMEDTFPVSSLSTECSYTVNSWPQPGSFPGHSLLLIPGLCLN